MAFDTDNFAKDDADAAVVKDSEPAKSGTLSKMKAAAQSGNPAQVAGAAIGAGVKALGSLKKGGKIRKTGLYKLHSGERVLNKKQNKKYSGKKA